MKNGRGEEQACFLHLSRPHPEALEGAGEGSDIVMSRDEGRVTAVANKMEGKFPSGLQAS
jgi:hypothetical protein